MNVRRMVCIALFAMLALSVLSTYYIAPAKASPPSSSPPPAPKTLAQIQSEAYALQAQINAQAGRKTSNASDGTGGTRSTLTNPNTTTRYYNAKSGVCSADSANPSFPVLNACDGNVSTQWLTDAGVSYPHNLVVNLPSNVAVSGISVDWNNYPPISFHIDCNLDGITWVPMGTFSSTTADMNMNRSYHFAFTVLCTQVRISGSTQSASGAIFMGAFEIWPFHDFPYGTGIYDSASLGMGDWSSTFKTLVWTQVGNVSVFGRVSNNSDMSSPSGWHAITNNTNQSSLGLTAGFFQYRAYVNGSTSYMLNITLKYVGQSTGDPPSKTSAGQITHPSSYAHTRFNLTVPSQVIFSVAGMSVAFDHSYVEYGGLDALLNITDESNTQIVGPPISMSVLIRNSTFDNGKYFFTMNTLGGVFRSGSIIFNIDNATLQHFDSLWHGYVATAPPANAPSVHDSDILDYNRDNNADTAIPFSYVFNRVRTHDYRPQSTSANGLITQNVRQAHYNYMLNGFLQFVYGSDGTGIAVGPGHPEEFVNWSFNYADHSRHTVFGTYGTAFGQFADPTLQNGYYQTIYRNYINNSRYIAIQSSGNVSGLRVIGNYIQGPSVSFSEGIGIFGQDHDFIVSDTFLFNMDTSNNVGISIGCFVYNVTVQRVVAYSVGEHAVDFTCLALKFKTPLGVEKSDYTWRGMSITLRDSYISGSAVAAAIGVDSGYVHMDNVSIVSSPAGHLDITDGWGCVWPSCTVNSTVWVDWANSYPDGSLVPLVVHWPAVAATHEKDFWVRALRESNINVSSRSLPVNISVAGTFSFGGPTYWGTLLSSCVQPGDGTTAQDVLTWTGHSCGPVKDLSYHLFASNNTAQMMFPNSVFNNTLSTQIHPRAVASFSGNWTVAVHDTGDIFSGNIADGNQWTAQAGHPYYVQVYGTLDFAPPLEFLPVLVFVVVITLILMGAWWLRNRREGT